MSEVIKKTGSEMIATQGFTTEKFIDRLTRALRQDGDFPACAKTVSELRLLISNPNTTGTQIAEVILREPSLGTRILHIVNSAFYRRAKPIMTISQAVVQIGMKPLAELCAGLVLLQRFVPNARKGGPFSIALRKLVLTSILASSITNENSRNKKQRPEETGFLAGCFTEIGTMLLAFYFPQLMESAVKRSESKKQEVATSIKQLTGLTPTEISIEIIKALELPTFYKDVLQTSQILSGESKEEAEISNIPSEILSTAQTIYTAERISKVVVHDRSKEALDRTLAELKRTVSLDEGIFAKVMADLPNTFKEHCNSIELELPALPDFVVSYSPDQGPMTEDNHDSQDQFADFVQEIEQAVASGEPTASVITTVMETFAWSLGFDRVLLLLVNNGKKKLTGRMLLGNVDNFDPTKFERDLLNRTNQHAPDVAAFMDSRPIFTGDPVFESGWPIAAIPVGFGSRAIGVIYADKSVNQDSELTSREQAAIGVLAELLDRSVAHN